MSASGRFALSKTAIIKTCFGRQCDLFGREKYGHLPKPLSNRSKASNTYEVGQIAYWSSGPDVAIYYRQDGEKIPSPGVVVLGHGDSGIDEFKTPGLVKVKIERLEQ